MAFSTGNNKKGPVADINVTPLVDVMLVLLVIFMITTPLILNGINLDLPKTKEVNKVNLNTTQIILSYTSSGELFIGEERFLLAEINPMILEQFKQNNTQTLYLRADYRIPYGKVAKLMSHLKQGGISNIALVTETEKK